MAKFTPDETGTKALWANGEKRKGEEEGIGGGGSGWERGEGEQGRGSDDKGVVLG